MATRATIALQNEDYTVTSIYTHWGGMPSHMGKMMLNHYNTPQKLQKLLEQGNASSVYESIGEKHNFEGERPKGQCTFYGRDRGDTGQEAQTHPNLKEYLKAPQGRAQEGDYCYVLTKRGWYFGECTGEDIQLQKLTKQHTTEKPRTASLAF